MNSVSTKRDVLYCVMGVVAMIGLTFFYSGSVGAAPPVTGNGQQTNLAESLPPGHRVVEGEIKFIRGRLAEVEVTQDKDNQRLIMPRFILLDRPQDAGAAFQPGDSIKLVVNSQNLVVDYVANSEQKR